jgi:D-cysteine desulfhydrase
MDLLPPVRISLARLPTPLERLERTGKALGIDLWVKRDDLTGIGFTGNKVRKLEFLCAQALERAADTLVTCGAVGSNHARATAVAAARLGMRVHLVLRGEDRDPPDGNLLLDRLLGATITFIPPSEWPHRDRLMEGIAAGYASKGRRAYVIPEGGSNALGSMGYALLMNEMVPQERVEEIRIRRIVHATGSAGTTAGIALGVAACGRDDVEVIGVCVCDDPAYFDAKIHAILDTAVATGFAKEAVRKRARWRVVDGYEGNGYAQTTPEEMADVAAFTRREGVILDPVYTGKAFRGLVGELKAGRLSAEGATVFLHTGGIYGLFAYGASLRSLPPA